MTVTIGRRELLAALGSAAAAWPLAARAQPPARVWRIGLLETIPAPANANFDALRNGLRELGYDEGRSLVIEYRSADGRAERFPALAAELVRLNVDVIVTRGTPSALAARNATRTIPIVMASIGDVIGTGLAVSLARPGRNVTGLTAINTDTEVKRLELLKEMVPGLVRIAALYNMAQLCPALEASRARGAGTGRRKPASRCAKAGGHRTRICRRNGTTRRRAAHVDRRGHTSQSANDPGACGQALAAGNLFHQGVRRERWIDGVRRKLPGPLPSGSDLHRQDFQGRQTGRSSD
jgi:putative ABC transport system substrate-binding protein